jgi:hypothetical protein
MFSCVDGLIGCKLFSRTPHSVFHMSSQWMLDICGFADFQATTAHNAVDETADGAREMLLELIQTLEDTAASSGIVTVLVDNLTKAIARVSS